MTEKQTFKTTRSINSAKSANNKFAYGCRRRSGGREDGREKIESWRSRNTGFSV